MTAIRDIMNIKAHVAVKLSREYVVPIIIPVIVVHTDAPKKRNRFMVDTDVPDMAVGYHSLTCVKDRVMKPPKNPNNEHIAIQNQ